MSERFSCARAPATDQTRPGAVPARPRTERIEKIATASKKDAERVGPSPRPTRKVTAKAPRAVAAPPVAFSAAPEAIRRPAGRLFEACESMRGCAAISHV